MNEVLYTHDMEPLTIIPVGAVMDHFLRERGMVRVPVPREPALITPEQPLFERILDVTITCELLHRNGQRHRLLFTNNEEAALLLRSDFLPGQRSEVQRMQREQFARGFIHALQVMG